MDVDDLLKEAVRRAIASGPSTALRTASEGLCRLYGPRPGCYCGKGKWATCHAVELYGDQALAVLLSLREAGIIDPIQAGVGPLTAARDLAREKRPGGSEAKRIAPPAP